MNAHLLTGFRRLRSRPIPSRETAPLLRLDGPPDTFRSLPAVVSAVAVWLLDWPSRTRLFPIWVVGAGVCASCSTGPPSRDKVGHVVAPPEVVARALIEFDRAVLLKPREGDGGLEERLAPLIVLEIAEPIGERFTNTGFGAARFDPQGHLRIDASRPTLYTDRSMITIQKVEYEQVCYLWWFPPMRPDSAATGRTSGGVRITLGEDGFPLVWEVLGSRGQAEAIFVSASLERAAGEAFGGPLPGRRYAVERRVANDATAPVVRVLEDGPIPMGPYIYFDSETRGVTTLLCRCMPSQVQRFVETKYYDLAPAEELGGWRRWKQPGVNRTMEGGLEHAMRWP